jgi:hypothetical protein
MAGGMHSVATAQNLNTLYATNNGGSVGGIVFFDVTVGGSGLAVTSFDTATPAPVASTFGFTVYVCPTTYAGNETNSAAWTVASTGIGTAGGVNQPSHVVLDKPFYLNPNASYGMAIVLASLGQTSQAHDYTDGNGSNQNHGNADLKISAGAAQNVPFVGAPFTPRVWNGTIYYRPVDAAAPLPGWTSTFSGAAATRGYWFTAPANFVITGFRVPNEAGETIQNVEVVRLAANPPAFPATTNTFTSLGRFVNVPANTVISTNIAVASGDVIGILGANGTATMRNSYGSPNFPSEILGQPVTFTRFGMQFNLNTTAANNVWTELAGAISRVEMYYRAPDGTWGETADAGDLPFTAQVTRGRGALNSIRGSLSAGEADMFRINVCNFGSFSASTVGGAAFDTQLFLFKADALGASCNDDSPTGTTSLLTNTCLGSNGAYYLAISQYNHDPESAGGLIFPNTFAGVHCNTGPGGGQPVSGWVGASGPGGAYTIALNGTCYADNHFEQSDAGEMPATADPSIGVSWLNEIRGTLGSQETDMYRVRLCNPGIFSASTVDGATFDSQLFLFNSAGIGVTANDDSVGTLSRIDTTCIGPTQTGGYLLAVSQYNRDPQSAGGLIFPNTFAGVHCNTAAGGASPLTSWVGASGTGGNYSLFLEGVCAVAANATPPCYANCDSSTTAPVLNVQDFTCFLQRYAANDPYANCDNSTIAPVLNVQDFTCFLQSYAAGCP